MKQKKTNSYTISAIAVKLYHSLCVLIVGSVEAAELSFLLFLLPASLVFDRVLAAFVVFHFQSLFGKSKKRSCLKIKSAQKLNGCYLIQTLIGPDS